MKKGFFGTMLLLPLLFLGGLLLGRLTLMSGRIFVYAPQKGWIDDQNLLKFESYVLPNDEENDIIIVNINQADESELDRLPGIGPVLAGRIIAYRDQNGCFESKEELRAVRGIGDALYDRLAPQITLK